jgi:60 kDa SS-A/Ro ribonucleoprotein
VSHLKRAMRSQTPQSQPLPSRVANSAGGFTWAVGPWERLRRFLILGSEGGTYYISERNLTFENVACLDECMKEDSAQFLSEVISISKAGRAPRNDQAIFALAHALVYGDLDTRKATAAAIPDVCRIGTHLFVLLDFLKDNRGWGALLRKSVSRWYTEKNPDALAYQVV